MSDERARDYWAEAEAADERLDEPVDVGRPVVAALTVVCAGLGFIALAIWALSRVLS